MGNSLMESLTLKHLLAVYITSKYTAFEEFEGDVYCRPSPQANLKGCGSRTTTKMELFDQVTLCLSTLERKDHDIGC